MASVTLDATPQIPLYFCSSLHTILTLTIMVQSYSWKKFLGRPFISILKQRSQWHIQDSWHPGWILPLSFVQGCPPGGVTHTPSFLPKSYSPGKPRYVTQKGRLIRRREEWTLNWNCLSFIQTHSLYNYKLNHMPKEKIPNSPIFVHTWKKTRKHFN